MAAVVMRRHTTSTQPRTTPGARTAWDATCSCGWGQGSYISEASAQAATVRHLAAQAQAVAS